MKDRKYVRFKVDMYEDTKFKIIDMEEERDVIHYIWNRVVLLAGKINLNGDLYLSRNIHYTMETLAIEFNRHVNKVKLAFDLFINLEMIEVSDNNVYRVSNFVKHQNIKIKEKEVEINKADEDLNSNDIKKEKNAVGNHEDNNMEFKDNINKQENQIIKDLENNDNKRLFDLDNEKKEYKDEAIKIEDNKAKHSISAVNIDSKKSNGKKKKHKKENIYEIPIVQEESICQDFCTFSNGERKMKRGETSLMEFSFG